MDTRFRLRCLGRDLSNYALVKARNFDGFLVTGQNSGTQWIKFMLSLAIAQQYDVPPPKYFNNDYSNDIIGNPKHKPKYEGLPRIASSHSIPATVVDWKWLRVAGLKFPPYAVVVRDIRDVLVSHYAKHGPQYTEKRGVDFKTYVRSEPGKQKFRNDIWWYMHFQNRWGKLAALYPREVKVWHYEDLRTDPGKGLREIASHFGLTLTDEAVAFALEHTSKDKMTQYNHDEVEFRIVREDNDQAAPELDDEDRAFIRQTLAENLRYPLGYDYA